MGDVFLVQNIKAEQFVPITATGGTISEANIGGINYRIHAFTSTGSSTFNVSNIGTNGLIDVLLVGGGGAGSGDNGAGGGAGGLVFKEEYQVNATSYTLSVGAGGTVVNADTSPFISNNGQNTTGFSLTALGGGAGGSGNSSTRGKDGGSGGGEDGEQKDGEGFGIQPGTNTNVTLDLGNKGGPCSSLADGPGGGGGGAGAAAASSGGGNKNQAGNGGIGYDMSSYFTTNYGENGYFAGGGAGGVGNAAGPPPVDWGNGGLGGGGDHYKNGASSYGGTPGLPNTGGGGGAGAYTGSTQVNAAAGGSGIVLIRYALQKVN